MPYARGAPSLVCALFAPDLGDRSGFWRNRSQEKSLERPDYGLAADSDGPEDACTRQEKSGTAGSRRFAALPPRTDRLPSSARPESATAMSGGTAIDTSPSTEITLIFSRSPRTSASVRSILARPAKATTSVPARRVPAALAPGTAKQRHHSVPLVAWPGQPRAASRARRSACARGRQRDAARRRRGRDRPERGRVGRARAGHPRTGRRRDTGHGNGRRLGRPARPALAEPQERRQGGDDDRDAEPEEQHLLLVVRLYRAVDERDRGHQDQHRDDPGLEVLQVVHLEPAGQPVPAALLLALDDEQLVEPERRDHERRADQEGVHDDQEQAEAAADLRWLAEQARGRAHQDVAAVHERPGRIEQQEDDRDEHQQPRQREHALEAPLNPPRPGSCRLRAPELSSGRRLAPRLALASRLLDHTGRSTPGRDRARYGPARLPPEPGPAAG